MSNQTYRRCKTQRVNVTLILGSYYTCRRLSVSETGKNVPKRKLVQSLGLSHNNTHQTRLFESKSLTNVCSKNKVFFND